MLIFLKNKWTKLYLDWKIDGPRYCGGILEYVDIVVFYATIKSFIKLTCYISTLSNVPGPSILCLLS